MLGSQDLYSLCAVEGSHYAITCTCAMSCATVTGFLFSTFVGFWSFARHLELEQHDTSQWCHGIAQFAICSLLLSLVFCFFRFALVRRNRFKGSANQGEILHLD